jgi:predicted DNA-binding transcriptional regulator AlpA
VKIPPLFSGEDRRRLIPLIEVAEITGFDRRTLRRYAINGTIPGARQVGPRKPWIFDRFQLEKWWQDFNLQNPVCK